MVVYGIPVHYVISGGELSKHRTKEVKSAAIFPQLFIEEMKMKPLLLWSQQMRR